MCCFSVWKALICYTRMPRSNIVLQKHRNPKIASENTLIHSELWVGVQGADGEQAANSLSKLHLPYLDWLYPLLWQCVYSDSCPEGRRSGQLLSPVHQQHVKAPSDTPLCFLAPPQSNWNAQPPVLLLDSSLSNISLTFLQESQRQGLFSWFVFLLLPSPFLVSEPSGWTQWAQYSMCVRERIYACGSVEISQCTFTLILYLCLIRTVLSGVSSKPCAALTIFWFIGLSVPWVSSLSFNWH